MAKVVYLDDWRFAVCDCCIAPVRRKDVRIVSRHGYKDGAEICTQCIASHFESDNYNISRKEYR